MMAIRIILVICVFLTYSNSLSIDPYSHYQQIPEFGGYPKPYGLYHQQRDYPFNNIGLSPRLGYDNENVFHNDNGYQGLGGYNLKKNHINDDYANNNYNSGVQGARKDLGHGQLYNQKDAFEKNGYNSVGDNLIQGHKKGHHRTGFKKSYHKDESGNDESYFDSDHDEGNRAAGKKFGDQYESALGSSSNGGHKLNEFETEKLGHEGYVGNGKILAHNQGLEDYYGRNGQYSNGRNRFGYNGFGGYHEPPKFGSFNPYY